MKIKSISCTQFAGLRDMDIELKSGLNVLYGANESGKSTLANLISRLLFQNARIDGRSDREFKELYFPSSRRSGPSGDFADGKIILETQKGDFTLTKEWGSEPRCLLVSPDGAIRDQKKINELLKDILRYGEGVYCDILLSTQRSAGPSLEAILDSARKTDSKQEISAALASAFLQTGGPSADAIGAAIDNKISEIEGKHWDSAKNAPVRKAGRWASGLGSILKAYYTMEDANDVLKEISRLEEDADLTSALYSAKCEEVILAQKEFDDFCRIASALALKREREKLRLRYRSDLQRLTGDLNEWPDAEKAYRQASALALESQNRAILDRFAEASKLSGNISELDSVLSRSPCPEREEREMAKKYLREISALENSLCAMNITADIRLHKPHSAKITSVRSGEALPFYDGNINISEAVKITVPGVMELTLAPADIDAEEIKTVISEKKLGLQAILKKYGALSAEQLDSLSAEYEKTKALLEMAQKRLSDFLGGQSYEELESLAKGIVSPPRPASEIQKEVLELCRGASLQSFAAEKKAETLRLQKAYGSYENLASEKEKTALELSKLLGQADASDIPSRYLGIDDPESYLESLKNSLSQKTGAKNEAFAHKASCTARLESFRSSLESDPRDRLEQAVSEFKRQKNLLSRWKHIQNVFETQKAALTGDPVEGLAKSFSHALSVMTEGGVTPEFPEKASLAVNIYSRDHLMDFRKLSEGTKEAVFLSYRLAMLDHLFPRGDGVMILDDPLSDMDIERAQRACRLLIEASRRHQIIFLTCRKEYGDMLGADPICLSSSAL